MLWIGFGEKVQRYQLCNSRDPVDREYNSEAAYTTQSDVMSIPNPVHSEF